MKYIKLYEEHTKESIYYLLVFNNVEDNDKYVVLNKNEYVYFINNLGKKVLSNYKELNFDEVESYLFDEFDFITTEIEMSKPLKHTNDLYLSESWEDFGDTYYSLTDNVETLNNEIIYNANELQKENGEDEDGIFTNVDDAIKYLEDNAYNVKIIKIQTDAQKTLERIIVEIGAKEYNL